MQIVMAVSGTRGDVQPAVVLGAELALRGHSVVMAVPPNLVTFARGAGLETVPFGYDTREHMNSDLVRHGVSHGSVADRARAVARLWNFGWDQMVRELTDVMAAVRPDILVTGITTEQIALPLAERFGAGLVALHHAPVRSNSRYSPVPGAESLPRILTPLVWSVLDGALWGATWHRENVLRRGLGLGAVSTPLPGRMTDFGAVEIQAYDPAFCPNLRRDWAQTRPFAGFLEMPSTLRAIVDPAAASPGLEAWLAAGPPPVYVGFGSMPVKDPAGMVAAVTQACDRSGVRALVSVGWNDAAGFSDGAGWTDDGRHRVVTGALDHGAVFPRCRAVVHHGGAGSTAAGIRAGKPTVVCSVASDQPFWGRRIVEQSCGATLPASSITAETMDSALRVALSPAAQRAARPVGRDDPSRGRGGARCGPRGVGNPSDGRAVGSLDVTRLQDQDFTYWFLSEAFGWDVVLQLVWTWPEGLPESDVHDLVSALTCGPLHRRIVRSRVPLARPRWERSPVTPSAQVDDQPIDDADVEVWARRELESVDLDAEEGRCWAVRSVRTRSGGSALSLTCLHLVADGRSMTAAAISAGASITGPGSSRPQSARLPHVVDDVADAVGQIVGAAGGVGRAVVAALRRTESRPAESRTAEVPAVTRTPAHVRAPRAEPAWATVTVDLDMWDAAARRHGGTRNSLFVAVVAGALYSTGYADDGLPVKVGIPMSLRRDDGDDRANATGGVSIVVTERPVAGGDLSHIRGLCRDAFAALSAGHRPAMIHLQPLLQILPLSVVTSLVMSGENGMPDVVASNLGRADGLLDIGSVPASKVAFRGTAQHVDPSGTQRFGEGVQSWYLESDGRATFAVAGFDESRVGSTGALTRALSGELSEWDVQHEFW